MIVKNQQRKQAKLLTAGFHSSIAGGLLFISFAIFIPFSAQVYKWVDEHGKTHYSDKPHDEKSESVQIRKSPTLDPGNEARVKKQKRLLKVMGEERLEEKQIKAAKAEQKRKREGECIKARKYLQDINNASFLYKNSDDPKNPVVYSAEERMKATKEADKAVEHWCK